MPLTLEGGTAMVIYKTADQSESGATLVDVTDMVFDVDANTQYEFEFVIPCKTASATTAPNFAVSCPASPTFITYTLIAYLGATASPLAAGTASDMAIGTASLPSANTVYLDILRGVLVTGANAGQIKLRLKSETAGTAVTVMAGCTGKLYPQPV